jgi:hypothetical protein
MQSEGSFRVRRHEDGAMELWAPGWRIEVRFLSLIPAAMAVGLALSSTPLGLRLPGCFALLGAAFALHRMTRVGILFGAEGIEFFDLVRHTSIPWADASAFVGERTSHDGKLVLLRTDGTRVRAPGSLTAEEMNPYGDEGDLSAVDELNRIAERFRRGLPADVPIKPRVKVKAPSTREAERRDDERRAAERQAREMARLEEQQARLLAQAAELEAAGIDLKNLAAAGIDPEQLEAAGIDVAELQSIGLETTELHLVPPSELMAPPAPSSPLPPALRHPHVPRPPAPEPEPEPTSRRERRRRRKEEEEALVELPESQPESPGARRLAMLDDQRDR